MTEEELVMRLNAEHIVRQNVERENAKLRTFLGGSSIVTDYWKDEDGTMHVLTTDGEHTYEYMRRRLDYENAKLRELVRYTYRCFVRGHDWGPYCAGETVWVEDRMRELGIEVDA